MASLENNTVIADRYSPSETYPRQRSSHLIPRARGNNAADLDRSRTVFQGWRNIPLNSLAIIIIGSSLARMLVNGLCSRSSRVNDHLGWKSARARARARSTKRLIDSKAAESRRPHDDWTMAFNVPSGSYCDRWGWCSRAGWHWRPGTCTHVNSYAYRYTWVSHRGFIHVRCEATTSFICQAVGLTMHCRFVGRSRGIAIPGRECIRTRCRWVDSLE